MEYVRIVLSYGGSFQKNQTGSYEYVGGSPDVITVPRDIRYNAFIDLLCSLWGLDLTKNNITLYSEFRTRGKPIDPVWIRSDSHLRFFIDDQLENPNAYSTMFVCVDDRTDQTMKNHPEYARKKGCAMRSGSGSNQRSETCPPRGEEPFSGSGIHDRVPNNECPMLFVVQPDHSSGVSKYPHLDSINEFDNCAIQRAAGDDACNEETIPFVDNNGDDEETIVFQLNTSDAQETVPFYVNAGGNLVTNVEDDDNDPARGSEPEKNETRERLSKKMSGVQTFSSVPRDKEIGSGQCHSSTYKWMPQIPPFSNTVEVECPLVIGDGEDIGVGQIFNSKAELRDKLSKMALRGNFEYIVKKSSKTRFEAGCRDNSCKWHIRATKVGEINFFQVRTYNNQHTCPGAGIHPNHRQATAQVIGMHIKNNFVMQDRIFNPKDIMADVQGKFGVDISYDKAWRAKEIALRELHGSAEESFSLLPQYMYMVEKLNPGTVTALEMDDQHHFMYFFMSLGASKYGFPSIRPVIAIDGAHLKGKYRGTMFLASCLDGNNQIFPLAFGVGHSENDHSWTWFLTKLRELCIGEIPDLVFISDRHASIERAITNVFPEALHGLCVQHIKRNLNAKFKNKFLPGIFEMASQAYRESEFNCYMLKIESIVPEAATYLRDIGVERWARCHFPGRRYSIMTTNIGESMNARLKDARYLPITMLADYYRALLQKWFDERRQHHSLSHSHLTQWAEHIVSERREASDKMRVKGINFTMFEVYTGDSNYVVDLQGRTCTCRVFDLDQLPCAHALAACKYCKLRSCDDYCHPMYTVERVVHAYACPVIPVGNCNEWIVPDEVKNIVVLLKKGDILFVVKKNRNFGPTLLNLDSN